MRKALVSEVHLPKFSNATDHSKNLVIFPGKSPSLCLPSLSPILLQSLPATLANSVCIHGELYISMVGSLVTVFGVGGALQLQ